MNSNVVGAGLKTTVEDLFKWDQNFYANRLPDGPAAASFSSPGRSWTTGKCSTSIRPNPTGLQRMGFTGGLPGFVAGFVRFPEQKFSVICLSNDGTRPRPWPPPCGSPTSTWRIK